MGFPQVHLHGYLFNIPRNKGQAEGDKQKHTGNKLAIRWLRAESDVRTYKRMHLPDKQSPRKVAGGRLPEFVITAGRAWGGKGDKSVLAGVDGLARVWR